MKKLILGACAALAILTLAACDDPPQRPQSADVRDRQATEQLAQQATVQVGWPAITNFTEKRELKMLYELRDDPNLVTYSYTIDFNGKRHKVCPTTSIGYGIPYATEYTNSQKPLWNTAGAHESIAGVTIGQPEPNGLFPPASAEGTWVMCKTPDGKDIKPVYAEPRLMVYPFEMSSVD